MNSFRSAKQFAAQRPFADDLFAAFMVAAFVLFHFADLARPHISQGSALIIYQTLAGIAAVLLGLVFAAIAIIRALDPRQRVRVLQAQHGKRIADAMKAVIRGLGEATILVLTSMLLDQPGGLPVLARALAIFAVGLTAARMTRLAWLFSLILDVDDADSRDLARENKEPPPLRLQSDRRASG